ncbi:hypothetical protein ACQKIC_05210 [Peribacillus sp. NPDC046944]|uniref:hypothetical protein n=1 Tax=Peribacillus sp. NPDC046944 TaxID=3390607 RepID=UPI003D00B8DD
MERKARDSCGKRASTGDTAGVSQGGSRTARGKRVPGVEIYSLYATFMTLGKQASIYEVKLS